MRHIEYSPASVVGGTTVRLVFFAPPYVECVVPISELRVEDLDQLSSEPSSFCVRLVFEEVGLDLAEV